ncbi:MAG: ketopantoate reductase family protein [Ignavibacteriae bacterium]|nr:ketopantoate reductase family protein [Ignavibacteriota bacterium]
MEESKLKIGIIGLGPVGLILAVHFKEAGCEVAICDTDKEKMNLIRNHGVELIGSLKKSSFFNYNYSSVRELLTHDIDVLISSVKSYRIDTILDQVEKYAHSNLFLLCAQNGIEIGLKYTSHFDESQILRMVINFAGVLHSPNVVNVSYFEPPNYIASINDTNPGVAQTIASTLTSAGMLTESTDSFSINDQVWKKTILIAAISPICGLSNLSMCEAMSNADTVEIIEQSIIESMEVAKAEGIKFNENFVKLSLRKLKSYGDHIPSLAVDIANNRKTEIDYFNGKIVEYGRKHYKQTPLNLTFTNLVKAITKKCCLNENLL